MTRLHPHVTMTYPQSRRRQVKVGAKIVQLTPREHAITEVLLMAPGPLSRNDIIEAVWLNPDEEPESAYRNVDRIICFARRKGVPIVLRRHVKGYEL